MAVHGGLGTATNNGQRKAKEDLGGKNWKL